MRDDPLGPLGPARLDPRLVRRAVRRFLAEDVETGDATTERVVPDTAVARGSIIAREPCVVAGLGVARMVFSQIDKSLATQPCVADGVVVPAGSRLMALEGRAAPILTGERLALNLLQRLCGVATVTRRYVDAVEGTGVSISDTRKTTPGLRPLEKYAVAVGGGRNHRRSLAHAVLIKDNHVAAAGGPVRALERALDARYPALPVQIEVESFAQLKEVLDGGAAAVLLDNMSPVEVAEAVRMVRSHPRGAACWIEASGGITLADVRAYAEAGVDTISIGALTHSAPSVDIALDLGR